MAPLPNCTNIGEGGFRALFDAVPTPLLVLDPELTIVFANAAYARATLIQPEAVIGRHLFDIFPDNPDDPAADGVRNLRASLARVLDNRLPDAMAVQKYDIRRPDGNFEERHWSPVNVPVLGGDGRVRWIIHRVEDVSALVNLRIRSKAQDQLTRDQQSNIAELRAANAELARLLAENEVLQKDHAYLASIVESSDDAIISKGLDGTITSWNKAAEMLFGYSAKEAIGCSIAILIPVELLSEENSIIARLKRGESLSHHETARLHKNGERLNVSLTVSPIYDGRGQIIGASKIVRDITAQKRVEAQVERLREEQAYLADLVASSNDAIVARDNDGRITSWNPAAERMFGFTAAEVLGKSAEMLVADKRQREPAGILARLHRGDRSVQYEAVRLRKDGGEVEVSITASPIRNHAGEIVGTSRILRDIGERRRSAERLRNLQDELAHLSRWNMMGMMASNIAHELSQPLTATINYVRAARRTIIKTAPYPDSVIQLLDRAADEIKLAGGILRSLRAFIDKREVDREWQDINIVIEEAVQLSPLAKLPVRVSAMLSLDPNLPFATVDKVQIQQVLLNLIRNALEAMEAEPSGGELSITTRSDEDAVIVSVADTGPGLAPAVAKRLFQPFTTTKEGGMGVGLAICQSIIEAHGGSIWAEPGTPRGTRFSFRLPAAGAA